jgi:hypothetical protein
MGAQRREHSLGLGPEPQPRLGGNYSGSTDGRVRSRVVGIGDYWKAVSCAHEDTDAARIPHNSSKPSFDGLQSSSHGSEY